MKTRKISVYEDFNKTIYILLKGKWLNKLGFSFHDSLIIEPFKDKIIIRKVKDPNHKI